MSLMSSMRMAANALAANQIALQVVGQNIANANTDGYVREEVLLSPSATVRYGSILLGSGVQVVGVVQQIDLFLESRLRSAISDRANAETQQETYVQLQSLLGELSDSDLSSAMNGFFSSIDEVLNQPEDVSIRNLAVLAGQTLTTEINRLSTQASSLRASLNDQVVDMAQQINQLLVEVGQLNLQIVDAEGGGVSNSDAVGLRDQRLKALQGLSELIGVQADEQPNGSVSVYCGGDYLVLNSTVREVEVVDENLGGYPHAMIQIKETESPLNTSSGQLNGLLVSRDEILTGFLTQLDDFSRTLAFEFNKVFSGGQGLSGYKHLTAEFPVDDADLPLNAAGLEYQPASGSFQVLLYNSRTGSTRTTEIDVDLDGLGTDDTTLEDIRSRIDAIDGIAASISSDGRLSLESESPDDQIAFAADTSGVLAALGLNTFFSGSSARDLGVNEALVADPTKFAASKGGIGEDTDNAVELADFLDRRLESRDNLSINNMYTYMVNEITQDAAMNSASTDAITVFEETLRSDRLATTGVSVDEEAIMLVTFQRAFQASAKFISTLQELLDTLLAM